MASWATRPYFQCTNIPSNFGPNTITIYYKAVLNLLNNESNPIYQWQIRNESLGKVIGITDQESGSISVNVTSGAENIISVWHKIRFTKTTDAGTETNYAGGTSNWVQVNYITHSNNSITDNRDKITIYTRNNKVSTDLDWGNVLGFSDVAVQNKTATASYIEPSGKFTYDPKVTQFSNQADEWLTQWKIWRSWYDQTNRYGTNSWNGFSLIPVSPISAEWYNTCCEACEYKVSGVYYTVNGGYIQDIKASHFRALAKRVTTWD